MAEHLCPKCSSEQVTVESRQVKVPKPLHPKGIIIGFGVMVVLMIIAASSLTREAIAVIESYLPFIGGGVAVLFLTIWIITMRRERTLYLYRCEACGRRWSGLGIDAHTPEDRQTAAASGKFMRFLLWSFVGLIGLVIVLALFFGFFSTS